MATHRYNDVRSKSVFEVTGELIARACSEMRNDRWTKLDIFRLKDEAGKPTWCVVTTGVSRLFHSASEPCKDSRDRPLGKLRTWDQLTRIEDDLPANESYQNCRHCLGEIPEYPRGDYKINMELDRSRIAIVHSSDELYEALAGWDPVRRVKFLSNVGKSAWDQIKGTDPDVTEYTVKVQ